MVVDAQVHGLRQRPLELLGSGGGGEVEEGAGDRGDGDALVAGGVPGIEGTRAVQADPRDPVPGRGGGDVDALLVGAEQAPVRGGAAVAEHRPGAAGQHRREAVALGRARRVADGVNAAVHAPQAARAARQ